MRITYTDGRTGLDTTAFRYKLTDSDGTLVKDWTTGATWTEEPAGTYYLDDAAAVPGTVYAVEPVSGEVGGVGRVSLDPLLVTKLDEVLSKGITLVDYEPEAEGITLAEAMLDTIDDVAAIPTTPLLANDARVDNLNATISSRSTLTEDQVWAHATRALTDKSGFSAEATNMVSEPPTAASIASAVWGATTRTLSSIADSAGVTSLLSRLTTDRAAKLDRDIAEKADVVVDVEGVASAVVALMPPPADGVLISQDTVGTSGQPLGQVMPFGTITVYLGSEPMFQFTADADGDFSYRLPAGSTWILVAKARGYRTTTAGVTT